MTFLMKVLANSNIRGVSQNRCFVAAVAEAFYFHGASSTSACITEYASFFLFYIFLHIFVIIYYLYCFVAFALAFLTEPISHKILICENHT